MKYINIMGPLTDIERVVSSYIACYEVHLENTVKELSNEKDLVQFNEPNPYESNIRKLDRFMPPHSPDEYGKIDELSKDEALGVCNMASELFDSIAGDLTNKRESRERYGQVIAMLEPFCGLDCSISEVSSFKHLHYQFGKMPVASFKQFQAFLYKDSQVIFDFIETGGQEIYGAYYTALSLKDKTDSVFSTLHFEKIELPSEYDGIEFSGTPKECVDKLKARLKEINDDISETEKRLIFESGPERQKGAHGKLLSARKTLNRLSAEFEIRKYAAVTVNNFYIFVGWMTEREAKELERSQADDENVVFIIEEDNESIPSLPPTKLKNPSLFRPFEFFVKMYATPSYDEIDPTIYIGLTYTLLFGIMFGDLGHGFTVMLLGLFLKLKKNMQLGSILAILGVSSMFFGVMFGSVFGYEFHALWMHPADEANITNILIMAVGLGIFLNLASMVFNMLNCIRKKEYRKMLFDPNGAAGFLFYSSVIVLVVGMITGMVKVPAVLIVICVLIPIAAIALREPLLLVLEKRKLRDKIRNPGMYLFELIIELFEICLSYMTNTVSFVRVGAFALSHASIMLVVWSLSRTATEMNNPIILIFGNLLVMAMEGVIAGIQVLRLEFYEIFSRFYTGKGRDFVPMVKNKSKRRVYRG